MTVTRETPRAVERAALRLARGYERGTSGYDDLAAPDWEAFLVSRRRFLAGGRRPRGEPSGGPFPPRPR